MQENNSYSGMAIVKAILEKWLLIVLVTILCALVGFAYSAMFIRPTYTASRSVILRLSVGDLEANTVTTNVSLAKIYLEDVKDFVRSPDVVKKANEVYPGEGEIKLSSISVPESNEDIDSLIFSISYTDMDKKSAEQKLDTVIESVMLVNDEKNVIVTEDFALIDTQNKCSFSMNNEFTKYIILGAGVGILVSVLIVVIMFMTDNTVVTKEELEEVTGADVLSCLRKSK